MRGRALPFAALVLTAVVALGGRVRRRRRSELDRPLQRPAPPAHDRARLGLREADRYHGRRLRTNDGVVLADQLLQEGHSSPADVFIAENSPELMNLEQHGLLAKLSPSVLSRSPPATARRTGEWLGIALRVSSLVYNPSLLPRIELPTSILDLAEPALEGEGRGRSARLGLPADRRRCDRQRRPKAATAGWPA